MQNFEDRWGTCDIFYRQESQSRRRMLRAVPGEQESQTVPLSGQYAGNHRHAAAT